MMVVFFIGIGVASILTSLAETPWQIGAGLLLVGVFASIYHPVGLAMVVHGRERTGIPLAVNGVFGNLGVASAALLTGFLIDHAGWRTAFVLPGAFSIGVGFVYALLHRIAGKTVEADPVARQEKFAPPVDSNLLVRVFVIVLLTTGLGGLVFQSTTFALPKVFDERLQDLAKTATAVGWYVFVVFSMASVGQLIVGYLVDRHSARTVFMSVAVLQAVLLGAMVWAEGVLAVLLAAGFMLVVFGQIPINDVLIGRMTRSTWRARMFSLRYAVTFLVQACSVPMIAWLHARWGFGSLFAVMAGTAVLIFTVVSALPARSALIRATRAMS